MKILAIETSCDDTAVAAAECSRQRKKLRLKILAEAVSSQIKTHRPYGGIVPALAKREHIKNLPIILKRLKSAGLRPQEMDLIAVTVGPGLEPALWTGINFANDLSRELNIPIVGVNHLEGHLFSNWINPPKAILFPAIVLLVSGGHTILLKMGGLKKWQKLGETRDDAVGEAFDKIAKMLGLPYPGGPEIEKIARHGSAAAIKFPRPMVNAKNYDFSFSGLKTAVLYFLRDQKNKKAPSPKRKVAASKITKADVAASFQQAAVDVLVKKTMKAAKEFNARSILLCGGVAANKKLREIFRQFIDVRRRYNLYAPELKYNTDNAVMIAAAACWGNHYPPNRALANLSL